MASNLNLEKYGAQFKAFAEFAAAHKNQDWVVSIEGRGRQPGGQELLGPNGEPRFLDNDNAIPFKERAVKFAESLKIVIDKAKECQAKLPKAYGSIVADTILGVLKTSDEMFDADDLRKIDADMCEKIAKVAGEIDTEDLLSVPEDRYRSAKSLSKKLNAFHQASSSQCAAELLSPGDSQLVVAVKQRLLMCMSLTRDGSDVEEFADEIEERYDDLAGRYGMKSLLDELAPVLGRRSVPQGNE